jgi:hypothetical protein
MVLTRAEGKDALTHVIKNVFQLEDDNPLSRALSKDDLLDIADVVSLPFEHIGNLTYIDDQGDERKLVRRYTITLHLFKSYCIHRRNQGNPIGDNWTGITYEDVYDYRVGPDYRPASTPPTPTTLTPPSTRKRIRDPIADFKKSVRRYSSVPPVPKDVADPVPPDEKASGSGFVTDLGMEKIESLDDNLATSTKTSLDTTPTDTSNFVSPVSPDDDMWLTIARDSLSYWDSVAQEADLHLSEKNGLLENDEIVFEHVTDSRQQVMLPDAVNFVDEMHIFEVPSPVLNTAISSSIPLVMPPLPHLLSDPRRKSSSTSSLTSR